MYSDFFENEDFDTKNFSEVPLTKGEYEYCSFSHCIFTNSDCAEITFSECEFENCDLSNATLKGSTFREVDFKNCKLLGLRFDGCNSFLLSFKFEACVLNFSSFYGLDLKKIRFIDCKMQQVDFMETNLQNSIFRNCDLSGSIFENTNLEGADMRSAFNFSMDPEINSIKKAKFSSGNCKGLLTKHQIIIE